MESSINTSFKNAINNKVKSDEKDVENVIKKGKPNYRAQKLSEVETQIGRDERIKLM